MKPTDAHNPPPSQERRRTEPRILSPLGRKQLFFILLFSSLVTLVGTSVQLTLEYRNDVGLVYEQLEQIEKGYLQSLTHSLWKLDDIQINIELKNMLSLRDVVALEILEKESVTYQAGATQDIKNIIFRTYDMIYEHDGTRENIGRLRATASLSETYNRLGKRILVVLVTQGVKTFIVSLFILFVIHFMVTRHLVAMANYVRRIAPTSGSGKKLSLSRRSNSADELDEVVRAINGMEKRLHEDLEKRKELEAQLYQAHKMEAIGTLAGGIAHDFNNILTIIMGNAELAVQSLPSDLDSRRQVEEIYKASLRAKDVIAQLLKFSRKMESTLTHINPAMIVNEAHNLIRSSAPSNITIEQHVADDVWTILADPTQIHQIILNLCTNAIHAMASKRGHLQINLANKVIEDSNTLANPKLSGGKYVLLEISDTGEGIPKAHLDKIFDPYFSTKSIGKGTGMGLSVVHGIVTNHKGAIGIESQPGHGTTVSIYLPASEETMPAMPTTKKQAMVIRSKAHILLVDDEPQVAALGQEILHQLGYSVEVLTHPQEAIERIRSAPSGPDLLITDLSMPGLSGLELAGKVHALKPELPIILCSGLTMRVDPVAAEVNGISIFLEKPYNIETLSEAVCDALHCEYASPKPND